MIIKKCSVVFCSFFWFSFHVLDPMRTHIRSFIIQFMAFEAATKIISKCRRIRTHHDFMSTSVIVKFVSIFMYVRACVFLYSHSHGIAFCATSERNNIDSWNPWYIHSDMYNTIHVTYEPHTQNSGSHLRTLYHRDARCSFVAMATGRIYVG